MMLVFKMRECTYLSRDISPFVMYCVYGEYGSSLLIEPTDSMIWYDVAIGFSLCCLDSTQQVQYVVK